MGFAVMVGRRHGLAGYGRAEVVTFGTGKPVFSRGRQRNRSHLAYFNLDGVARTYCLYLADRLPDLVLAGFASPGPGTIDKMISIRCGLVKLEVTIPSLPYINA